MIFNSLDLIILEVSTVMPILDYMSQFIMKNDILKQYTMWNFYIFIKFLLTNNVELLHFLTSNFIMILFIFHTFFLIQPKLLFEMPKKMKISNTFFHFQNIIFHICPPIYCLTVPNIPNNHTHMYCNTLLFIWIIVTGHEKLDTIYSIKSNYKDRILLLCIFINFTISKLL